MAAGATLALLAGGPARAEACAGDCDGDLRVLVHEVVRGVNIGLGVLSPSVCPAADADDDQRVSIDETITAVRRGLEGCPEPPDRLAFVVATDFESGGFATVSLDEPRDILPVNEDRLVNSDATARVFGRLVYVVNRFLADNIQALDPADDFRTLWQCSTGNGSNPQDFLLLGSDEALVTRLAAPALLVVDPSPSPDCRDFEKDEIDLSAYADADGVPEMDQMALAGGLVYVSLQRLTNFSPEGPGKVVAIDPASRTVVRDITLAAGNPFGATKGLTVRGRDLLVSEAGRLGVLDGGIERIDLGRGESEGFLITERELGGDLNDFVIASDRHGYAVVARPDFSNSVVSFDPRTGLRTGTLLDKVEFVSDIEINDRGELFLLDRTFDRPGVRIFRATDGREVTQAPLDVGLPPFQIVFLR